MSDNFLAEEITKNVVECSKVKPQKNYLDYLPFLRKDFWYSCAYCSITEVEAQGIGFEIDHYYPTKHFPDSANEYTNLMYSCEKCNRLKGDYFPDLVAQKKGNVILNPDKDDPREHLELKGVRVEPKTQTGEFNEVILRLNRQSLCRLRDIREKLYQSNNYIAFGMRALNSINIDTLKQEYRPLVASFRSQFGEKFEAARVASFEEFTLEDFIQVVAKSEMLDEDPNKATEIAKRRKYLKDIKAITSESIKAVAPESIKSSNKIKRKRKK